MKLKNKEIVVRRLDVKSDARGWLAEILRREDLAPPREFGQLFVTVANVDAVRGNHYHTRKHEWFCAIQGEGVLVVENNETGERDEIFFGEKNMLSVAVPPNHTHALKNSGSNPLLVLIYISEPYNPEDPDTHKRTIV